MKHLKRFNESVEYSSREQFIKALDKILKTIDPLEYVNEEKQKKIEDLFAQGIVLGFFTAQEINDMKKWGACVLGNHVFNRMARKTGIVNLFKEHKFDLLRKLIDDGLELDDQLAVEDSFFYRNIASWQKVFPLEPGRLEVDDVIVDFVAEIEPAYLLNFKKMYLSKEMQEKQRNFNRGHDILWMKNEKVDPSTWKWHAPDYGEYGYFCDDMSKEDVLKFWIEIAVA